MDSQKKIINELRFQLGSKEVKDQHYPVQLSVSDANAILALLKEQEPVEPKEIINDFYPVGDYRRTLGWHCGKCGRTLMGDGDFCSYCGQAVKWE